MIVGLYFIIVITFLHGSASDCGFTTTFYKAASLVVGRKLLNTGTRALAVINILKANSSIYIRSTKVLVIITCDPPLENRVYVHIKFEGFQN